MLTRNAHELALVTLQAVGMGDCFLSEDILGRDEHRPPHPGGLLHLAERWGVAPASMLMVGTTASTWNAPGPRRARVLVNVPHNEWPELADLYAPDCRALHGMLG